MYTYKKVIYVSYIIDMSKKGSTALIVLLVVSIVILLGVVAWWQMSAPAAPAPLQRTKNVTPPEPPATLPEPAPVQ